MGNQRPSTAIYPDNSRQDGVPVTTFYTQVEVRELVRYAHSLVEYMVFPRLLALAEVAWLPADRRDVADFERRLMGQYPYLDSQKVNFRQEDGQPGLENREQANEAAHMPLIFQKNAKNSLRLFGVMANFCGGFYFREQLPCVQRAVPLSSSFSNITLNQT